MTAESDRGRKAWSPLRDEILLYINIELNRHVYTPIYTRDVIWGLVTDNKLNTPGYELASIFMMESYMNRKYLL